MLSDVHFILTYTCNFECDHCFLYCSPRSTGTFSLKNLRAIVDDLKNIPTVRSVGFEGGEPFLFYPLLLEAVRYAAGNGFGTAIQTNTYWAADKQDAQLWLGPLAEAGLDRLEVSDDAFHHKTDADNSAKKALAAATAIGLPVTPICIEKPRVSGEREHEKGAPIYLGGPKLRGRAVTTLAPGLPVRPWESFDQCPFEDLRNPKRVHIDPYGHVHLCQGLTMGNALQTPLSDLLNAYRPDEHPICGPLLRGGPAQLARETKTPHADAYVDACHLCTDLCTALVDRHPDRLAPRQVYGIVN